MEWISYSSLSIFHLTIPSKETFNGIEYIGGSRIFELQFQYTTLEPETRFIPSSSQDGSLRYYAYGYPGGYKHATPIISLQQRPAL